MIKKIILILPNEASMNKNEEFGLLPRWKRLIDEYKNYFEDIEIYTCDKDDFSSKLGVKHYPCKILIDKKYIKAISYNIWLLIKIRGMKADILRFFGSVYPFMPLFKRLNKTPKILSYQYDFYQKTLLDFGPFRGKVSYYAEKYSVKYIGNILTTTNELKQILLDRYNLNSTVNPNFVDLDIFKPSDKTEDYLFFAGRIFYTKGIDLLIEMVRYFNTKGRRVNIKLAGKGDVDEYRQKVAALGLTEQITFLGALPSFEVAKYMAHCKMFVFPTTTQEGHPKSLIEALASGCPCVASRVLGNTEVIQDGENGLLIEPGSQQDLIEKVEKLLDDEQLMALLKINAYKSSRKFDVRTVVKNEVDVITNIITAKN